MDYASIPSPFYRVSVKVLVFDDQKRLLVCLADKWEVPGGGLEHNESIEDCVKRELQEELDVEVESIGSVAFTYPGINPRGYQAMRLVVPVKLKTHTFKFGDKTEAKFVTKEELMNLDMQPDEAVIKQFVDQIWPD